MLCAIGCNSETYWDVDCRYSFHEFEERYYPIDATPEAIRQVASDQVPDRLDGWLLAATHLGRTYSSLPASGRQPRRMAARAARAE
jgi:hypothetical protein